MQPEVYVAFNHIRDFVKREAPIVHPKLERSLRVIEAALEQKD